MALCDAEEGSEEGAWGRRGRGLWGMGWPLDLDACTPFRKRCTCGKGTCWNNGQDCIMCALVVRGEGSGDPKA